MVWNKTSEDKILLIQKDLEDLDFTYKDIAAKHKVSYWLVGEVCRQMPKLRKERYSRSCSKSKIGSKNPMSGKVGMLHHNAKEGTTITNGYKTIFPPSWWVGTLCKGRVYEHILIACERAGLTKLPPKHCVHHLDHNKFNNDPDNLKLMSISEHMKHHMTDYWKVQRLSRKGVGNSIPEAPDNPTG